MKQMSEMSDAFAQWHHVRESQALEQSMSKLPSARDTAVLVLLGASTDRTATVSSPSRACRTFVSSQPVPTIKYGLSINYGPRFRVTRCVTLRLQREKSTQKGPTVGLKLIICLVSGPISYQVHRQALTPRKPLSTP